MKTLHPVSLKLRDLEKNLTLGFLVLSDKLVFIVHLLLASVHTLHQVSPILWYTVVKLASYAIVRLRGPSRVALQCSLPNRKLNVSMINCRTMVIVNFLI